ncbi:exocytic docking protein Mso1 [Schizosaccharomyces osmophilus]|uniref:Exocytic docking protein Mso1 n=1 Tax=Schizosaccharomyces osmophilus TaxID=2545709 RepID=A0AAE9WCM0_9SCHI|nr:exocytic docking protein Mso1 [Schizosaccharomyces osmophilus]WBW73695.1 exocytic docking protein Mso1 [Schizosaccharomyces osmophilus]
MWSKLSISSKINRIRDPESDNSIEDTHVARVMRKYYLEKTGNLPDWLRPPGWQPPSGANTPMVQAASSDTEGTTPSNSRSSVTPKPVSRVSSSPSVPAPSTNTRKPPMQHSHSTFDDLFEGVGSLQRSQTGTSAASSNAASGLLRSKLESRKKL